MRFRGAALICVWFVNAKAAQQGKLDEIDQELASLVSTDKTLHAATGLSHCEENISALLV
jgi:hypothetical protein